MFTIALTTLLAAFAVSAGGEQTKAPAPVPAKTEVAAQLSIADFIKRPEFSQMKISPTGEYVAVTVPLEDNKTILAVLDRTTGKPVGTMQVRGDEMVDKFWWANKTRLIVSIAEKLGGIDKPVPNGELYGINFDGSGGTMLFGYRGGGDTGTHIKRVVGRQARGDFISTLPGNDKEILIAAYAWDSKDGAIPTIEKLDVYTGKSIQVGVGPGRNADMIADNKGEVRLALAATKGQSAQLYYRDSGKSEWRLVNDEQASGVHMEPMRFARDNQHFYIRGSVKDGPDAVYRFDPKDDSMNRVYQGGSDPVVLLSTADDQDAYGVVIADGKYSVEFFDAEAKESKLTKALAVNFKGELAYFSSFTTDGRYGVVSVESDRNPGEFFLFDLEKKSATFIAGRQRWINPEAMAEMKPISLKARDGLELHGYLTVPRGSSGKNLPLVVHPHGGPYYVRDSWEYDSEVQLLASRGYAVLQINFRGSGGYGKDFQTAGYRQWGGKMQDDVTDATLWAIKEGYADKNRICIYGGSYGGYATLEGLVREPDLYKCGIGYAGVYDLRMMYSRGDIQQTLFGEGFLALVLGGDRDDLYARSPISKIDKLKAAVMIIHGGQDKRVPVEHAKALKRALDENHRSYEWLVEDGEGHGFYKTTHQLDMYTKLLGFLDKQIGAGATAAPKPAAATQ